MTNFYRSAQWIILIKLACFILCGLYRGMWRHTSIHDLSKIIKACAAASGLIVLVFLAEKKEYNSANATCEKAPAYLAYEPKVEPSIFFGIHKFHMDKNQLDKALEMALKGIEHLPENVRLRTTAASLYKKLGITYRAEEEYVKALILNPN